MTTADSVRVTTLVAVSLEKAFTIFTEQISQWWISRPPHTFGTQGKVRFENGRLIESSADADKEFEIGKVLVWEPPSRLEFDWRQPDFAPDDRTIVSVEFTTEGDRTRVTVEHKGWDRLTEKHPARHGLTGNSFTTMIGLRWADLLTALRAVASPPRSQLT